MKYERLTKKGGLDFSDKSLCLADEWGYSHIYNRLAELEDKIEQGTLIELPCKVGDSVWIELVKGIDESGNAIHYLEQGTVLAIQIEKEEIWLRVSFGVLYCCRKATDFILTKAEAVCKEITKNDKKN